MSNMGSEQLDRRCRYIQDAPFWGAIRPNCMYGLISRGVLNEGVECLKCDKYRRGERQYSKPFNILKNAPEEV